MYLNKYRFWLRLLYKKWLQVYKSCCSLLCVSQFAVQSQRTYRWRPTTSAACSWRGSVLELCTTRASKNILSATEWSTLKTLPPRYIWQTETKMWWANIYIYININFPSSNKSTVVVCGLTYCYPTFENIHKNSYQVLSFIFFTTRGQYWTIC